MVGVQLLLIPALCTSSFLPGFEPLYPSDSQYNLTPDEKPYLEEVSFKLAGSDHAASVRVRDPANLGIERNARQMSGYVDLHTSDKHLFFWLFESRNDPSNDPVVLWLNGGPGCSSNTGLFFELGPAKVSEDLKISNNPWSWNSNATLIFLDQPVNTGFSYSPNRVNTSNEAGEDVYSFLTALFEAFPEYNRGQSFHIAGESYCGHYIPAIGNAIVEKRDKSSFKVSSLMIGNGITDVLLQTQAQVDMACGRGGYPSVLEIGVCEDLYRALPKCEMLMQECYDTQSELLCELARNYCEGLSKPYAETGRNPFQIDDICWSSCYPQDGWIDNYLNQQEVKFEIGAKNITFVGCSPEVGNEFRQTLDRAHSYVEQLRTVLESDIPVLLYAGDLDYRVNWLGVRTLSERLVWSGHDDFVASPMKTWEVDGKPAGEVRSSGGLTFKRIYHAGHMVPFNKPKVALSMLNEWLVQTSRD